jgi:hypothetical protein
MRLRRRTPARSILVVVICGIFAIGHQAAAQHLKGKLKHDVYTSPGKDFQITVGGGLPLGIEVADGVTTKGLLSSGCMPMITWATCTDRIISLAGTGAG